MLTQFLRAWISVIYLCTKGNEKHPNPFTTNTYNVSLLTFLLRGSSYFKQCKIKTFLRNIYSRMLIKNSINGKSRKCVAKFEISCFKAAASCFISNVFL